MFQVFSVDTSREWIGATKERLPESLAGRVHLQYSEVEIGAFDGRLCHYYKNLPDIVPDFIYLDGPDVRDVTGNVNGLTASGLVFPCAADPCFYEWGLYPGFQMLVDGRFANVEFLKKNLKRDYKIRSSALHNNTLFELIR